MVSARRLTSLAVAPLLFLASACSDGSEDGGLPAPAGARTPASGLPPGTEPSADPSTPAPESPDGPGADGRVGTLTAAQLREVLVPESAFPAGWSVQRVADQLTEDPPGTGGPRCDAVENAVDFADGDPAARTNLWRLASSPGGQAIESVVVAAFDHGDAAAWMRALDDGVAACPSFTQSKDGVTLTVTVSGVPAPDIGDEAIGIRLISRGNVPSGGFAHTHVLVRTGDVIVSASDVNLAEPVGLLPNANERLLRQQVEQVEAALAGDA